jgi:hypothetical protein
MSLEDNIQENCVISTFVANKHLKKFVTFLQYSSSQSYTYFLTGTELYKVCQTIDNFIFAPQTRTISSMSPVCQICLVFFGVISCKKSLWKFDHSSEKECQSKKRFYQSVFPTKLECGFVLLLTVRTLQQSYGIELLKLCFTQSWILYLRLIKINYLEGGGIVKD